MKKGGMLRRSPNQFEILLLEVLGGGAGGGLARRQLSNSIITYHKGPDGLLDRYHHLHHHQVSNFFAFLKPQRFI